MSLGDRIGYQTKQKAQVGMRAVQRAKGMLECACGIASAKDAGPWFLKNGFQEIKTNNYINGDIIIIEADANHVDGHIQVFYEGKFYSDFKQNTANPWAGCKIKAVYRSKN